MQAHSERRPLALGKNRIEALSDGIFAIVMTLLILEIHLPDLPSNAANVQVAPALWHLWPKFFTYVVTFLSLGVYWIAHHNMYHAIRRADRVLLWLTILFFMFVSMLPFSTSVLNTFRQTQIAPLFFGANLTAIGWLLYLQWAYAGTQPDMLAEFVTPEYRHAVHSRFIFIPVVATLGMLVCFWSAEILLAMYAALLPGYMISSKAERQPVRHATPAAQSSNVWGVRHGEAPKADVPGSRDNPGGCPVSSYHRHHPTTASLGYNRQDCATRPAL